MARRLGRAPSTVSEVLRALREDGLVEEGANRPTRELFWRTAEVWPRPRRSLSRSPSEAPGPVREALGYDVEAPTSSRGWALGDTLAAAAYGAPVLSRADGPEDWFVPSDVVLRRATTLLGVPEDPRAARATVRVAPVEDVCSGRVDGAGWSSGRRPLAAPLYVALDLAGDAGRGREVLDAWTPPSGWARAW